MISNKYKYAFCDLSFILVRSLFAVSKGKKIGEFTSGDVIRLVIQTLNKIPRDYGVTADRVILLVDKWSKEYGGYYRNYMLKDYITYKGSRKFINEWDIERMKSDPSVTPEELEKAELELYSNRVKQEAKKIILSEFPKFGITSIMVDGLEADDLCWMAACMLYDENEKPSIIITKDSDQQYCLTPKFDYFRLPTHGSEPEIITYEKMYYSMPEVIRNSGVSLYDYHSFLDSLGEGHNDLGKTSKSKIDPTTAILRILAGNFEDVENVDLFKLQMQTFDLNQFPAELIEDAKQQIININNAGRVGSVQEFKSFCDKYKIFGISERYFSEFTGRFDQKLFTNTEDYGRNCDC